MTGISAIQYAFALLILAIALFGLGIGFKLFQISWYKTDEAKKALEALTEKENSKKQKRENDLLEKLTKTQQELEISNKRIQELQKEVKPE